MKIKLLAIEPSNFCKRKKRFLYKAIRMNDLAHMKYLSLSKMKFMDTCNTRKEREILKWSTTSNGVFNTRIFIVLFIYQNISH